MTEGQDRKGTNILERLQRSQEGANVIQERKWTRGIPRARGVDADETLGVQIPNIYIFLV